MTEVFRIASKISAVSENPEIQNLAYEISIYSLDHEWNGEQNTEEEAEWYRKYHKVLSYFEIEEIYFSLIENSGISEIISSNDFSSYFFIRFLS